MRIDITIENILKGMLAIYSGLQIIAWIVIFSLLPVWLIKILILGVFG